eukprot:TRINITY_DN5812_c0_g1_i6.p1 TRINITY_DN5812_c0_g1~~TRINITY_DN5812_c0_g1_i6.p1  ORF type:complete len:253 (+),score=51.65 TRINITY_DN5812_c0_g1_i6:63-761(+)
MSKSSDDVVDVEDVEGCGFCALHILDADAQVKRTKGFNVEAPWHFSVSEDSTKVYVKASFVAKNPLFFLQLSGDEDEYLAGCWWAGGAIEEPRGVLCILEPRSCQELLKEMETNESEVVEIDASLPLCSRHSTGAKVRISTESQRLAPPRVSSVELEISAASWLEWKAYRRKLRAADKVWPSKTQGGSNEDTSGAAGMGGGAFTGAQTTPEMNGMASVSYDSSGPPPPCTIL